ncbi:hypothetical protein JL09_g4418 [Pichia kudriavzevii]|uniref:Uncharacterized protein n=2 Tax=Pichia kudriavzevii TaxID=4909 RepID=A0A099NX28_PICKU|nr:hypothetical protein JL09_g4418 [Pichia kudriavzevii]
MNTSTTASTTASTSVDLGAARAASLRRVRETWTRIIQHYSQVDDTYGDIVDLHTGAILRDNGHLRSMGDAGSLWRADVGVDLVSGHEKDHNDNSDNQHGQFNIQGESLPHGQHSTRATGNAVSGQVSPIGNQGEELRGENKQQQMEEILTQRDSLIEKRNALRRKLIEKTKRSVKSIKPRTLDTYKYAFHLVSCHSRLPSLDIEQRLQYAKLASPQMSVPSYRKMGNSITMSLDFASVGVFTINLSIGDNGTVSHLSITPPALTIDESVTINTLVGECQASKNISLFIYRLNTLVRMREKRRRSWYSLLPMDVHIESLNNITVLDPHTLFAHSPATLAIKLRKPSPLVTITWLIDFTKSKHCTSDFHVSTNTDLDLTDIFKALVRTHGVKMAVVRLLSIL